MTLPTNSQIVAVLRKEFGERVFFRGSPEGIAENVLRIVRLAMGGDAPVNDYKQFRKDNPDIVTVDE